RQEGLSDWCCGLFLVDDQFEHSIQAIACSILSGLSGASDRHRDQSQDPRSSPLRTHTRPSFLAARVPKTERVWDSTKANVLSANSPPNSEMPATVSVRGAPRAVVNTVGTTKDRKNSMMPTASAKSGRLIKGVRDIGRSSIAIKRTIAMTP